jgi:hypothetical protein
MTAASRSELVSVLVALEFVVVGTVVVVVAPIEAAAPLLPLLAVFSYGVYRYVG